MTRTRRHRTLGMEAVATGVLLIATSPRARRFGHRLVTSARRLELPAMTRYGARTTA